MIKSLNFGLDPKAEKIKIKTRNPGGILNHSTIEVNLRKGWIWREGGVPFIKLDKDNNQIQWETNIISATPKEIVDEIADTAYQSGTMVGFSNLRIIKQLLPLILLNIAITGIGILATWYFVNSIHITTQTLNVIASNVTTTPVV